MSHPILIDMEPLVDSHIAEASNAAAVHEEARQKAFQESLIIALRAVLVEDEDNSPILVKSRIKRLCDSYEALSDTMALMRNDTKWQKWIIGVIFTILIPILGFFGTMVIKNSTSIAAIQAQLRVLIK